MQSQYIDDTFAASSQNNGFSSELLRDVHIVLLLTVNRPYGRADYLPCIAWGSLVSHCAALPVGSHLHLEGRLQSRQYKKLVDGEPVLRTAYEVSVMNLLPDDTEDDDADDPFL